MSVYDFQHLKDIKKFAFFFRLSPKQSEHLQREQLGHKLLRGKRNLPATRAGFLKWHSKWGIGDDPWKTLPQNHTQHKITIN